MRTRTRELTCIAAPVQVEGQLEDGNYFYFRSRHMRVSLGVGETESDAVIGTVAHAAIRLDDILRWDGDDDPSFMASGISIATAHHLVDFLLELIYGPEDD